MAQRDPYAWYGDIMLNYPYRLFLFTVPHFSSTESHRTSFKVFALEISLESLGSGRLHGSRILCESNGLREICVGWVLSQGACDMHQIYKSSLLFPVHMGAVWEREDHRF